MVKHFGVPRTNLNDFKHLEDRFGEENNSKGIICNEDSNFLNYLEIEHVVHVCSFDR